MPTLHRNNMADLGISNGSGFWIKENRQMFLDPLRKGERFLEQLHNHFCSIRKWIWEIRFEGSLIKLESRVTIDSLIL
jgi:hypothetical protein